MILWLSTTGAPALVVSLFSSFISFLPLVLPSPNAIFQRRAQRIHCTEWPGPQTVPDTIPLLCSVRVSSLNDSPP